MNIKLNSKKLFCIICALLFFLPIQAQILHGKVIDRQNIPIAFANIILMDIDSTFVTGNVSDDNGQFQLPLSENTVLLKITYIGYQDKVLDISTGQTDMGNIILNEDSQILSDVVIKGDLPKTRIKGDAMVTNVSGSILEKAGTAQDVLAKVPGVTLKGEDINVFGRGAPVVYINGREVRDPSELNQLTSDNIQHVEVVTNPGARYDKSVKAVIRILTKKKTDDGFGFEERANVSYNDKFSYMEQLNLDYRRGGLDLMGMFSFLEQSGWRDFEVIQKTYLDHYWEQQMHGSQKSNYQRLIGSVTLNYVLNPNHSLGGNYRFRRFPKAPYDMSFHTNVYQDLSLFEESLSNAYNDNPETRHEGNLYYNGKAGKWGIDFNGSLLHSKENVTFYTHETNTDQSGNETQTEVHTNTDTKNMFYAGKLILSHPLFGGDFSFGSEYTYTDRSDKYTNEEGIVADDDSRIKESLIAAFAEYVRELGKVRLQAGLRFENVGFNYYKSGVYQGDESKNYNNLFPSLSLSLPIGKVQTQLSYTSDITRPNYQMLRNRIDYINRYTYESGNPFLMPYITQSVALKVSYKWWQLYADVQRRKNAFIFSSEPYSEEDPTIALLRHENAPSYNAMNVMLNAAPTIGCWSPQLSLELYKQWYNTEEPGTSEGELSLDRPSFAVRWRNTIELPLGFTLGADVNWEGKTDQNNMSYKPVWWANASLYKEFLNKRLTFLLQANDIFNTYCYDYLVYYGRLRMMSMDQKFSQRSIALTVQYKFNLKPSKYKGTGAGDSQKGRL